MYSGLLCSAIFPLSPVPAAYVCPCRRYRNPSVKPRGSPFHGTLDFPVPISGAGSAISAFRSPVLQKESRTVTGS